MGVIAKKGIYTTIINLIGVAIAAVSILFIQTKFLTKDEIGAIKVLNSLSLLIFPFILLGFGSSVMKFNHRLEKDKTLYNQFITFVIILPLILLVIFTLLFYFFYDYISDEFFNNSPLLNNLLFLLPGMIFHFVYTGLMEAFMAVKTKILIPNLLKSIFSRIYLIILVFIYALNKIDFDTLLVLYVSLHIVNSLYLLIIFFKGKIFFSPKRGFVKSEIFPEFRSYSLYLILGALGGVLVAQIDVIMTGALLKDLGEVGVYTVAFFMGVVIEVPKRPLIQLLIPQLSKSLENDISNVAKLYKQSAINLSLVGVFLFLLIWVNIDNLFEIIPNGEIYQKGKYVVLFIGLAKIFDLSLGVNYEIIQYSKFYKWNLFLMPFLAIISIISNFIFINIYGIVGTAIATAISVLVYNIVRSYMVFRAFKMHSFSVGHLKIISISMIILIASDNLNIFDNPYLSIIFKTLIISTVYLVSIYFMCVSVEANRVINTIVKKISR